MNEEPSDLSLRPIHPPSVPPSGRSACSGLSDFTGDATDKVHMTEPGPKRGNGIPILPVSALAGQHELFEADWKAVGKWMIDVADDQSPDFATKIVTTQIVDPSEFRVAWRK